MQAAVVATYVDTKKTYWLPASYFDKMETLNQLDLLASEFDTFYINPKYLGITSFKISTVSSAKLQADKFQPKLSDTAPEKDWRYAAKTVISIYVMNRAANGSVVWTKTAGRELTGAMTIGASAVLFGAASIAFF